MKLWQTLCSIPLAAILAIGCDEPGFDNDPVYEDGNVVTEDGAFGDADAPLNDIDLGMDDTAIEANGYGEVADDRDNDVDGDVGVADHNMNIAEGVDTGEPAVDNRGRDFDRGGDVEVDAETDIDENVDGLNDEAAEELEEIE